MEDRTKIALTAMRKILRVTETNAKVVQRETGLTPSQLILLQVLDDGVERPAGHIAARMGISQATTTALIHKLEMRGLIARRRGENDRRQVWISLTEEGQKVLAIAPDGVHARFHQKFSQLSDWEQAMLVASLERVADMLGAEDMEAAAVFDAAAIDAAH